MKRAAIYRAWTPPDGAWTPWVKPVLFASLEEEEAEAGSAPPPVVPEWFVPKVLAPLEEQTGNVADPYRDRRTPHDTAVVIDLPGGDGAELGVALVQHGFCPIPLYNALPMDVAIVDVGPIMDVLVRFTEHVRKSPATGAPAFLLDADRMGHGKEVRAGLFDNRSICRSSDFPSVERFRQAGIRRVLFLCETLQEDLEAIALEWQEAGLEIWSKRPTERHPASPIVLRRPWWGRRIWLRLFRLSRRPGADGAYGVLITVPTSS